MSIKILPTQKPINKSYFSENSEIKEKYHNLNTEKRVYSHPQQDDSFIFLENQAMLNRIRRSDEAKMIVEKIEDLDGNLRFAKYLDGTIQTFKKGKLEIEIAPDYSTKSFYPNGNLKFQIEQDGTIKTYTQTGELKEITYPDGSISYCDNN